MKNKVLYFLGAILSSLLVIFHDDILNIYYPCYVPLYLAYLWVIAMGLTGFFFYRFFKVMDNKWGREFWWFVITFFIATFGYKRMIENTSNFIVQKGGVITKAVIYDRYYSVKGANTVYFSYEREDEVIYASKSIGLEEIKRLNNGDTILVIYSVFCPNKWLVYDFFPTTEMLKMEGMIKKQGILYNSDGAILPH